MPDAPRFLNSRPNLEVSDLDRALAFYVDVLGLPLRLRADEFALAVVGEETGCENRAAPRGLAARGFVLPQRRGRR